MTYTQQVSTAEALRRGFTMRCPNCGTGRLFGRFLKVLDHCSVCGEEFCHHRADDFPAYIVIFVVGHAIVPAALAVEIDYAPPMWLEFLIWLPLIITSALALLQPTKGAIVGLQWQLGMHGFEESKLRQLASLQPHVPDLVSTDDSDHACSCGPSQHKTSREGRVSDRPLLHPRTAVASLYHLVSSGE